jgi:hypothetical protein
MSTGWDVVYVASIIAQSKLRRRVNFTKMHPRERDFWMARAWQAIQGDAHTWAIQEAMKGPAK